MRTNPPRILAVLPGLIPSTVMGVVKPLIRLHEAGRIRAHITLEWLVRRQDVERSDMVIFCRNIVPERSTALHTAVNCGIPFLYDIDDNFFELPLDYDEGRLFRSPEYSATLTRYLTLASLVRVYSKPLWERAKSLNPNVERVSAPVDLRLISSPACGSGSLLKIVYVNSRPDGQLYKVFLPALRRVLKHYAGRLEIHFWGCRPTGLAALPDLAGVCYHPIIRDYDRFLRSFSQAGFDIGLAPLHNDVFHRSKTNNKFREYAACRIAGIYSNVDVYSDCVRDGETGLLVENDEDAWHEALVRLLESGSLRSEIQSRGRAYVEEHYCQEHFEEVFWGQIQRVLGRSFSRRLAPRAAPAPVAPAPAQEPAMQRIAIKPLHSTLGLLRRQGLWRTWKTIFGRLDSYRKITFLRYRLWSPSHKLPGWLRW